MFFLFREEKETKDVQLVKKLFAHPRKDTLFHYLLFN